jgi:hypothetical protein
MEINESQHNAQAGETTEPAPSELNEGFWSEATFYEDTPALGFLQMCVERRFYRAIQEKFEELTKLTHSQYWIHTDAGGTPKMTETLHDVAPDYCYDIKEVRIMGWAAHGTGCGGYYPEDPPDGEILRELRTMLDRRISKYGLAKHYAFFAVEDKKEPPTITVWCIGPIMAKS